MAKPFGSKEPMSYWVNKFTHTVLARIGAPEDGQNWKQITREEYLERLYGGKKWKRKSPQEKNGK